MIRRHSSALLLLAMGLLVVPLQAQTSADHARAIALLESGRLDEARVAASRLFDAADSATAYQVLGRIELQDGDLEAAQESLERAVELGPESADHRYWLSSAYLADLQTASIFRQRGLANRMREALLNALELDPTHVAARSDLIQYYLQAPAIVGGSTREALRHANELATHDRRAGYLLTARIHAARDDHDMATVWFEAVAQGFPDDAEVLYEVGMYHQGREEWEAAFRTFEAAAGLPTTDPNRSWTRSALYQVGRTSVLSGTRLERGVAALREFNVRFAEPVDALTAGAHWRLGMLYERLDRIDEARGAYEAALEIDPEHAEAGRALRRIG